MRLINIMFVFTVLQDAEIRVDLPNPVYGDSPYTSQPGGCGEQGEYTQVCKDLQMGSVTFVCS